MKWEGVRWSGVLEQWSADSKYPNKWKFLGNLEKEQVPGLRVAPLIEGSDAIFIKYSENVTGRSFLDICLSDEYVLGI